MRNGWKKVQQSQSRGISNLVGLTPSASAAKRLHPGLAGEVQIVSTGDGRNVPGL